MTRTARTSFPSILLMWGLGCGSPPVDCEFPDDALGAPRDWERERLGSVESFPDRAFIEAEDGLRIAYRDYAPAVPAVGAPVVLFVHGSSAHGDAYALLGTMLAEAGVHARLVDLRGHGASACAGPDDCDDPDFTSRDLPDDGVYYGGRPGDSLDDNQIARDLGHLVAATRRDYADARVVLAGHSSGGGVVSRYVEHGGIASVDAVILLAPFNHVEQPQNLGLLDCGGLSGSAYAQVSLGAVGDAIRGNVHRYVLQFNKAPHYITPVDTLQWTWTTMNGMSATTLDTFVDAYDLPVLWIAAELDAVMDLELARSEFERLPAGGAFVEVTDTTHIGLSLSEGVADTMAAWAEAPGSVSSGVIER